VTIDLGNSSAVQDYQDTGVLTNGANLTLSTSWSGDSGKPPATYGGQGIAQFGSLSGSLAMDSSSQWAPGWNDAIIQTWETITPSGPPGTNYVDLRFTLQLTANLSLTATPQSGANYGGVSLSLRSDYYSWGLSLAEEWMPNGIFVTSGILHAQAGIPFDVYTRLGLGNSCSQISALCSLATRGSLYVDVLTPGCSILTASGQSYATPLHIDSCSVVAGQLNLACSGPPNASCTELYTMDCTQPLSSWIPVATNTFDINGTLSFTNAIDGTAPKKFFALRSP